MISKCANPACSAHFLYLHRGRVFRIMRAADCEPALQPGADSDLKKYPQVEFFWLCERCSEVLTVRYKKESGVIVQPLRAALRAAS
jgi:hypothetical protein